MLGTFGLLKATGDWPLLTVAFSVALLVAARRAERGPSPRTSSPLAHPRAYLAIQALEYAGFAISVIVSLLVGRPDLVGTLTVAISGVHFFALAVVIGARASYVKGALLCAIVVATPLLVPPEVRLQDRAGVAAPRPTSSAPAPPLRPAPPPPGCRRDRLPLPGRPARPR